MNIGQIRFFVSAVELGSFSRVAKQQSVTVQAVSKAIIGLETQLGNELFSRGARGGVTPTEFGLAFYEQAVEALGRFDGLENFSRSYTASHRGPSLRLGLLTPLFRDYGKICAGIAAGLGSRLGMKTELIPSIDADVMRMLGTGEIDGVISLGKRYQPVLDCLQVGSVPVGVVMSTDHELAGSHSVALADAARFPLAYARDLDAFTKEVLASFAGQGLCPEAIPIEGFDHYVDLVTRRQALVLCVAAKSVVDTTSEPRICLRSLVTPDGPMTVPLYVDTLSSFKSPQFLQYVSHLRGLRIF